MFPRLDTGRGAYVTLRSARHSCLYSPECLEKLSEKGSSNARSLGSAAIRGTKGAEKRLLGGPQGHALDASEAFRTVSEVTFSEVRIQDPA
jgi:hypothetical protein